MAAALYPLIGTARLNPLAPEAYLRHVLSNIADHSICRIKNLLPWNVIADVPALKDQLNLSVHDLFKWTIEPTILSPVSTAFHPRLPKS